MKNEPEWKYYINFTREEITHVQMTMELLEQDYLKLRGMKTDKEIEAFINEKQETVCYTPGKVDNFYEWKSGRETVDGEGELGLFDFSVEEWKVTTPNSSSKYTTTYIGE